MCIRDRWIQFDDYCSLACELRVTAREIAKESDEELGAVWNTLKKRLLQGIDANTVSEDTVSGSTVELTVSNNIKNDETVKVAYTDPTGGNDPAAIQNSAGVDAASLGITAVTNRSTMAGNTPVYVGSTTSTDGTKIILTYNKPLSSTTAAASAFTVTSGGSANAVTTVAVSGLSLIHI